jgi:hypothetical protein
MSYEHTGAAVTHHRLDLFFHVWPITVNETFSACAFLLLEWALVKAHMCVAEELAAFRAETVLGFVVSLAVNVNHCLDSFLFSSYSRMLHFRFGCHLDTLSASNCSLRLT